MLIRALLLLLHLLAAAVWVGGMAAMNFAVRPAAAQVLSGTERLRFMAAVLSHFMAWVATAIVVLLVSGLGMIVEAGGLGAMHWSVHAMALIGLVMVAIFGHLRFAAWRRLDRQIQLGQPQAAAATLAVIRHLVVLNLALGAVVFGVAVIGRVI